MRPSVIKAKLSRNEPVLLTMLHLIDPCVYEMASLMGFDGIWLDCEHHAHGEQEVASMMRAARVGTSDILARPAKGEFMKMGRLLELGAHGIMYPRCDDAAEAREVVKWSKFHPLGKRGVDAANADAPYLSMPLADYIKAANDQTFIAIQVEEQHAVDNAQQIADIDGVDVVFLGPGDFTILSGIAGQCEHPMVLKALEKIAHAARKAGKHWGTVALSPEHGRRMLDMGAMLLCASADLILLKQGLERFQEDYAAIGFTFNNQLAAHS
jgi:4-hydroxy-2-oxoheptanedioate aldolase